MRRGHRTRNLRAPTRSFQCTAQRRATDLGRANDSARVPRERCVARWSGL